MDKNTDQLAEEAYNKLYPKTPSIVNPLLWQEIWKLGYNAAQQKIQKLEEEVEDLKDELREFWCE